MDSGECIYNLIPRAKVEVKKPALYKSKFYGQNRRPKGLPSSFGPPPAASKPDPRSFLRRKEGKMSSDRGASVLSRSVQMRRSNGSSGRYRASRKDAVPSRNERPVYGIKTSKNFIEANAIDAILTAPPAKTEGPELMMKRPEFGKVPRYLDDVKAEIQIENDMIDAVVREHLGQAQAEEVEYLEELPDDERDALKAQLQERLDAVNRRHQLIAHHTKLEHNQKRKKEHLEMEMDRLEADIKRLSMHGKMYVAED
mmetsp:Transcript_19266/g.58266  ORF Transcript_19266/g.58266 Transcript_19266/m.58266 type:complete len:255 (-) Transcript_19266:87-851(-)|eukprot:CAMPEP_0118886038 /NCGR_PEP_ID=MMETSP1163-20130328/24265_1 /TAXON_ID=124430 /ORGANISM="Phaeomonas parva, Strain CCMP2877" /LENGTH=254 /DNA_ID=CAMNT_0006824167 /DNA_START=202 /DNA_END=966 /DNA_ORIENTATION=-